MRGNTYNLNTGLVVETEMPKKIPATWKIKDSYAMPLHTGMLSVCQSGLTDLGFLKRPLPGSRKLHIAPSRMLPKIKQMIFVSDNVIAL